MFYHSQGFINELHIKFFSTNRGKRSCVIVLFKNTMGILKNNYLLLKIMMSNSNKMGMNFKLFGKDFKNIITISGLNYLL